MAEERDFDKLGEDIKEILVPRLRGLLNSAESDIREYAHDIQRNMMEIMQHEPAEERPRLMRELTGQLSALAEKHRIKALNTQWQMATDVVMLVGDTLLSAALRRI